MGIRHYLRKLVIYCLAYSQAWDLNPTAEAKLSSGLTHVEGTYLELNGGVLSPTERRREKE